MLKKILLASVIAISILAYTACLSETVIPEILGYRLVTKLEDSPIPFVVTKGAPSWEIHFRKPMKEIQHEAVAVVHAKQPIAKISDPHSSLLSIQNQPTLSLDFFISLEKRLQKDECVYLSFQIRKSKSETIRYLVRIDKIAPNKQNAPDKK